jgi:hypothetical protein
MFKRLKLNGTKFLNKIYKINKNFSIFDEQKNN